VCGMEVDHVATYTMTNLEILKNNNET
jgi:hypothetical protein